MSYLLYASLFVAVCGLPSLTARYTCHPDVDINCPVDGGWSDWVDVGECSESCGPGVQKQVRTCTNPIPRNGGKNCEGSPINATLCLGDSCSSTTKPPNQRPNVQMVPVVNPVPILAGAAVGAGAGAVASGANVLAPAIGAAVAGGETAAVSAGGAAAVAVGETAAVAAGESVAAVAGESLATIIGEAALEFLPALFGRSNVDGLH